MSDDNTGIESPILTIRIGEGLSFFGRSPKTNYKELDLHSLQKKYNESDLQSSQIKVEEFLERLS